MKLTKFFLAATLIASTLHSQAQTQNRQAAPTAQQLEEIKAQEAAAVQRQKNPNSGVFNNFLGQTRICLQPVNPDVATNVNVYTYTPPDLIFHPTGYMSIIPSTMGRFMEANGSDPFTGQTIYSPVPAANLSNGQFFTQTTGRAHIQWTQPGWAQVVQRYGNNNQYTRTLYVFVNAPSENPSLADFTATKQDNCANPLGFTITRTNGAQLRTVTVTVAEIDASGEPVSGGYQWTYTEGLGGNWIGGTKTFTNGAWGLPYNTPLALQSGKSYNVSLTAESNCGTTTKTTKLTYPSCQPTAAFTINNSPDGKVGSCWAQIPITNTSTTPAGAGSISYIQFKLENANQGCTLIGSATNSPQIPGNPSVIDIKTLFTQLNNAGNYRLGLRAYNANYGWGNWTYKCMEVIGQSPADAEFSLSVGYGTSIDIYGVDGIVPRIPYDYNGAEVGRTFAGLHLTPGGPFDTYRIEVWESNPTTGAVILPPLYDSGERIIDANNPFPSEVQFNSESVMNGYFLNLSAADRTNKRFKTRFNLHNICGWTDKFSYFRISNACTYCRIDENGNLVEATADNIANQRNTAKGDNSLAILARPNPVSHSLYLDIKVATTEMVSVSIADALGRVVATPIQNRTILGFDTIEIDMAPLPAGIYYYTVSSATENKVGKFVKQ